MTREEAIMAVKEVTGMSLPWNDRHYEALQMAIKALEESECKTGRWIYHVSEVYPADSTQECDQCHAEQPLTCDDSYCPNCGAKMEDER